MSVFENEVAPRPIPTGHVTLYVRRDMLLNGGYKEFAYVGPEDEVMALARRCRDVDMLVVEELLRKGLSFEDALKELGVP